MLLIKNKGEARVAVMPPGISILFSFERPVVAHIDGVVYRTTEYERRGHLIHINRYIRNLRRYCPEDYKRTVRLTQRDFEQLIANFYRRQQWR